MNTQKKKNTSRLIYNLSLLSLSIVQEIIDSFRFLEEKEIYETCQRKLISTLKSVFNYACSVQRI